MFDPSLTDVRMFFFNVWDKSANGVMFEGLEKIAYSIILEHNEYHNILKNKEHEVSDLNIDMLVEIIQTYWHILILVHKKL